MSTDFDVAIVGGGPAGASVALHLVRREGVPAHRIVVVDKATFPREKPCAGAISELGVRELAAVGVDIRASTLPHVEMRGVRILDVYGLGQTEIPMGIVVRRSEADAMLLDQVRADGVDVRDGSGLVAITRGARGTFELRTEGRVSATVTAGLVAACDGAGSTTRKLLGVREPERKGHLYVLETEPTREDTGCERGLIDFDLSILAEGIEGYYWDFPTIIDGRPHVSRGIYHANLTPRSDVKLALGRSLAKRGIDIAKVKLKPFSTRPFVSSSLTWLERVPGVMLVGEAAGIDRATGEGIAQAIAMGRIAAKALARSVKTGFKRFDDYDREVRTSVLGRHLLQSAWLSKRVYGSRLGAPARRYLVRSDYARVAAMRWYVGETLPIATQLRLGLGIAGSVR